MKNFALAMIATTLLGWANYAQANGYIFNSCSSTVSADSGTTGRVYNETAATYCSCADYAMLATVPWRADSAVPCLTN